MVPRKQHIYSTQTYPRPLPLLSGCVQPGVYFYFILYFSSWADNVMGLTGESQRLPTCLANPTDPRCPGEGSSMFAGGSEWGAKCGRQQALTMMNGKVTAHSVVPTPKGGERSLINITAIAHPILYFLDHTLSRVLPYWLKHPAAEHITFSGGDA